MRRAPLARLAVEKYSPLMSRSERGKGGPGGRGLLTGSYSVPGGDDAGAISALGERVPDAARRVDDEGD